MITTHLRVAAALSQPFSMTSLFSVVHKVSSTLRECNSALKKPEMAYLFLIALVFLITGVQRQEHMSYAGKGGKGTNIPRHL